MESAKGGRPGQSQDFTPGFYDSTILRYAAHETEYREEVNMRKLLELGKTVWTDPSVVLENARYLQRELPRRLARRLLDLQFLPYIVVINPNIKRVYNSYYNAFQTLRNLEDVRDEEANRELTVLLKRLVDEHGPMVEALAAGLRECKSKPIIGDMLKLDDFLEAMLTSRISRRVLAEQHIALQQKRQNYVGIVNLQLDLREAVDFAFRKAQQVCVETYGVSPEIRVSGDGDSGDGGGIISYIPTHLDYMLFELMKNAMRATVERNFRPASAETGGAKRRQSPMPPVSVKICRGDADVTIKICDQGGGIDGRDLDRVWNYGYTTMDADDLRSQGSDSFTSGLAQPQTKMAGLGFGLPLSRLHARYFGGNIEVVNVQGYGVDVYLNLKLFEDPELVM